jgi:hypothetical protein
MNSRLVDFDNSTPCQHIQCPAITWCFEPFELSIKRPAPRAGHETAKLLHQIITMVIKHCLQETFVDAAEQTVSSIHLAIDLPSFPRAHHAPEMVGKLLTPCVKLHVQTKVLTGFLGNFFHPSQIVVLSNMTPALASKLGNPSRRSSLGLTADFRTPRALATPPQPLPVCGRPS